MSSHSVPFYIRTAGKADLPAVRELLVNTWHDTYDRLYGIENVNEITGKWHSAEALRQRLDLPNSEFLVADDGKTILGMAFATFAEETIALHQIYVASAGQRRGVGGALLDEMLTCFDEAQSIKLKVDPGNAKAIAFYAKRGFVETGRTENCGQNQSGIPALIFEKNLD